MLVGEYIGEYSLNFSPPPGPRSIYGYVVILPKNALELVTGGLYYTEVVLPLQPPVVTAAGLAVFDYLALKQMGKVTGAPALGSQRAVYDSGDLMVRLFRDNWRRSAPAPPLSQWRRASQIEALCSRKEGNRAFWRATPGSLSPLGINLSAGQWDQLGNKIFRGNCLPVGLTIFELSACEPSTI